MPDVAISIHPLDLLFFRGGRPFAAGLPGVSTLPTPQALAGLIRSFLLERNDADFQRMRGIRDLGAAFDAAGCGWLADVAIRGPFLHHEQFGLVFKAPAALALVNRGGEIRPRRIEPLDIVVPGWTGSPPGARPLLLGEGREKKRPEYITQSGLARYLAGNDPEPNELMRAADLFCYEERVGIGIDPETLATEEGVIYTTHKLALRPEVSFYAEMINLPEDQTRHFQREAAVAWGGERHHVRLRRTERRQWGDASTGGKGRTLVYLATPCFEVANGLPAAIPREAVRAAVTAGPAVLSGWDLASGGPKPTRFGVDAGSVIFVENADIPNTLSGRADTLAGYGLCLKGNWNYAN